MFSYCIKKMKIRDSSKINDDKIYFDMLKKDNKDYTCSKLEFII